MDKIPPQDLLRLARLFSTASPGWYPTEADERLVRKFERFKRTGEWKEWWQ